MISDKGTVEQWCLNIWKDMENKEELHWNYFLILFLILIVNFSKVISKSAFVYYFLMIIVKFHARMCVCVCLCVRVCLCVCVCMVCMCVWASLWEAQVHMFWRLKSILSIVPQVPPTVYWDRVSNRLGASQVLQVGWMSIKNLAVSVSPGIRLKVCTTMASFFSCVFWGSKSG